MLAKESGVPFYNYFGRYTDRPVRYGNGYDPFILCTWVNQVVEMPAALAVGISEALYNTALGIGTSALALIMYNVFTTKIDALHMVLMSQVLL